MDSHRAAGALEDDRDDGRQKTQALGISLAGYLIPALTKARASVVAVVDFRYPGYIRLRVDGLQEASVVGRIPSFAAFKRTLELLVRDKDHIPKLQQWHVPPGYIRHRYLDSQARILSHSPKQVCGINRALSCLHRCENTHFCFRAFMSNCARTRPASLLLL